MQFLKDFSITSLTSVVITLIALLNNIIITRQIGPEGRGIYSVISNIILLLSLLFGEGVRRSNTILIGQVRSNLNKLVNGTLVLTFFLSIIFAVLYFNSFLWRTFLPNISNAYFALTLIISVFSIIWMSYQALFLGMQKILTFNLVQIISTVSFFIITFIGIYLFKFNIYYIVVGLAASSIITSIVCLFIFFIRYNYKFSFKFNLFDKNFILLSQKSTISAAEIFLLYKGDIFLVNFFLGTAQTGLYSVAVLFSEFFHRISNVIGPLLISKTVSDKTDAILYSTAKVVRVVFFINLIIVLLLIILGKKIILILFGNEFQFSFLILLFLMPGLLTFSPGSLLYAFFMGKGYPKNIIIINAFSGVLNIILNIILLPKYGVVAAAIISSLTYFLWTVSLIISFKNTSNIPYNEIVIMKKQDMKYIYSSIRNLIK